MNVPISFKLIDVLQVTLQLNSMILWLFPLQGHARDGGGSQAAATPPNQNLKNIGFCRCNIKCFT
jgi:hypothetical protein